MVLEICFTRPLLAPIQFSRSVSLMRSPPNDPSRGIFVLSLKQKDARNDRSFVSLIFTIVHAFVPVPCYLFMAAIF